MSALQHAQSRLLPALEAELRDMLTSIGPLYHSYYEMMHYHMGWLDENLLPTERQAGKRVRPLLCLLACAAAGGQTAQAMPAAAGIETLHNFSLLHDDIEDRSDTRRGRATAWKLWGVPQAINTGDGMFALAHLAFARLPQRGVPVERAFAALSIFEQTCLALTHGQYLDIGFEDRLDVTVGDYLTMIEGKTAALVATSTHLGALLAAADAETVAHYRAFGRHLGLAFQIRDDILGIWGDASATGKSTSADIETRKKTLPVVYGLERSQELRRLYATELIPPEQVAGVAQMLEDLGARKMAEALAAERHRKALAELDQALADQSPVSPASQESTHTAGQALRELATSLLNRVS
jgi:geranylgeranyl diphosphate synthase type I